MSSSRTPGPRKVEFHGHEKVSRKSATNSTSERVAATLRKLEGRAVPGELDTLRKLVLIAEQAFEAEGILRERPVDLLREALKCVRNEVAVMGDAETQGMGTVDGMTYLRVERRIDLALALADYREEFGHRPVTVDQRDGASE